MLKGKFATLLVETKDPSICFDKMEEIRKRNKNIIAVHQTQPVEYQEKNVLDSVVISVDEADFVIDVKVNDKSELKDLEKTIKKELKKDIISVKSYL